MSVCIGQYAEARWPTRAGKREMALRCTSHAITVITITYLAETRVVVVV